MPYYPVDRATNFIVEDENWISIECDFSSVPGVIYISLTENKVNLIYDDLVNDLADTDKIAQYQLLAPAEKQIFAVGDAINPVFTLTKNGIPIQMPTILSCDNKAVAHLVGGVLTAIAEGIAEVTVTLADFPQITTTVEIEVANNTSRFSAYIAGADRIRLDRESSYVLIGTDELIDNVTWTCNSSLVSLRVVEGKCILHANDNNQLGEIILEATYQSNIYTKTIKIIPVW